jgi:hypothetical protein
VNLPPATGNTQGKQPTANTTAEREKAARETQDFLARQGAREAKRAEQNARNRERSAERTAEKQREQEEERKKKLRAYQSGRTPAVAAPAKIEAPPKPAILPGTVRVNPIDGLEYIWAPAGSYVMGCEPTQADAPEDERPRRTVTLHVGFWISQLPVTVRIRWILPAGGPSHVLAVADI